jgi:hypothetical protein
MLKNLVKMAVPNPGSVSVGRSASARRIPTSPRMGPLAAEGCASSGCSLFLSALDPALPSAGNIAVMT